jgi:hypothetical protein
MTQKTGNESFSQKIQLFDALSKFAFINLTVKSGKKIQKTPLLNYKFCQKLTNILSLMLFIHSRKDKSENVTATT